MQTDMNDKRQSQGNETAGGVIRARALGQIGRLIRDKGGNPSESFARLGLDYKAAEDGDQYVSSVLFGNLLEDCSIMLAAPHFGMDLAKMNYMNSFGPLSLLMSSANDLQESLQCLKHYVPLHSPSVMLHVTTDPNTGQSEIMFISNPHGLSLKRQINEYALGVLYLLIKSIVGTDFVPSYICITADEPASGKDEVVRFFGCNVLYNQIRNSMVFSQSYLHKPVLGRNAALAELITRYLDERGGSWRGTVVDHVRYMVTTLLPTGQCTLEKVAFNLAVSPMTLQKQLAELDANFSRIVLDRRKYLAEAYLKDTKISLVDIAAALGYADQATFTRAFKAWSGMPPRRYRELSTAPNRAVPSREDAVRSSGQDMASAPHDEALPTAAMIDRGVDVLREALSKASLEASSDRAMRRAVSSMYCEMDKVKSKNRLNRNSIG